MIDMKVEGIQHSAHLGSAGLVTMYDWPKILTLLHTQIRK
jgi:hypothetical protein